MMANRITKGTTSARSVFRIVACPRKGSTAWMITATMTKITLAGVPPAKPALVWSTRAAPTMRIRPSTSKPIWVSQLKNEMSREPFGP